MKKYCNYCRKIIPEHRLKSYPNRKIVTCTRACSVDWNHLSEKGRKEKLVLLNKLKFKHKKKEVKYSKNG